MHLSIYLFIRTLPCHRIADDVVRTLRTEEAAESLRVLRYWQRWPDNPRMPYKRVKSTAELWKWWCWWSRETNCEWCRCFAKRSHVKCKWGSIWIEYWWHFFECRFLWCWGCLWIRNRGAAALCSKVRNSDGYIIILLTIHTKHEVDSQIDTLILLFIQSWILRLVCHSLSVLSVLSTHDWFVNTICGCIPSSLPLTYIYHLLYSYFRMLYLPPVLMKREEWPYNRSWRLRPLYYQRCRDFGSLSRLRR